jgi:hypothetical protein
MTNQKHPITPPPELVQQWCDEDPGGFEMFDRLATKAARWGADQELDACCEWVSNELSPDIVDMVRTVRRPKPPSLKEQALAALEDDDIDVYLIRRALEALPE